MTRKKKRNQRKRKFKTITFKLTERQKKSLDKYSKARNTTPIRLIKRAIATFVSLPNDMPPPKAPTTKNQLDLFIESELISEILKEPLEKE